MLEPLARGTDAPFALRSGADLCTGSGGCDVLGVGDTPVLITLPMLLVLLVLVVRFLTGVKGIRL